MLSIGRDHNGDVVEEYREHPDGPVTSRTVHSKNGNVTNTATGTVGIQATNVDGETVVHGQRARR